MLNFVQIADNVKLNVGSGISSGDPVVVGVIPAVAITDADANDEAACLLEGVFSMSVSGLDDSGNAAITEGDAIYLDTGVLNVDSVNGDLWGYALAAVTSGATATINVLLK